MKIQTPKYILFITLCVVATTLLLALSYKNNSWAVENSLEHQKWQRSHHQKSMLLTSPDNILGNFNNTEIAINGVTTKFYKKDNEYWVNTENENGNYENYKIEYTFGFTPLQQYLIKTQNGKYQVLPLSWDSRAKERGGQRWFHIYGDDHIKPTDRVHWTQPLQNWNGMCADCHSTGLVRNYSPESDSFKTSWNQVNVSCKSCHTSDDYSDFISADNISGWELTEGNNTAQWSGSKRDQSEIEVCAACHSRRTPITDGFKPSSKFLDSFSPTLIQSPEYYSDGQIKEEVYVWGSFLQSKMHSKGVICSDCHDPHSLELKASGNDLCSTCHLPTYFDQPSHHNHSLGSTGSQCVNCHMPAQTFMQVDDRRDHSFRIPRPDLSHATQAPNACTSCHLDEKPDWAAANIENWFGKKQGTQLHYGEILTDVMQNEPDAEKRLKKLIHDPDLPIIIRASGFPLLVNYPNEDSASHVAQGLNSSEPLIRLGAIRATTFIPQEIRKKLLVPFLHDDYKSIRVETVSALSAFNEDSIGNPHKTAYKIALNEYEKATEQTMWRGEGHYNYALFESAQGNHQNAKAEYLISQDIDPYFAPSYINLADIFRGDGDELLSGKIVDQGLSVMPDDPDLNFSKALHLIRSGNATGALTHLNKAVAAAEQNARYAYVYAVAQNDMGNGAKALAILQSAIGHNPNDENLNLLSLNIHRTNGNWNEALKYASNLSRLYPNNGMIKRIEADLKGKIK